MLFSELFISCQKAKSPLMLLILDIDHFKKFNDTYGHQEGDKILKEFSERIASNIRRDDIFARWGGEEFAMLSTASSEYTKHIAEHLRSCIAQEPFQGGHSVQCSIGVTVMRAEDTIDTFFKRADDALYKAKKGGRNRVDIIL
jgi:diguanylate cyclase (GGDEF)-like protein